MQNLYQTLENPENGRKFYISLTEDNHTHKIKLKEFLEKQYPKLYNTLIEEEKTIDSDETFFLYKQIQYENQIIGYVSYSLLDEFDDNTIILLDNYYLIPEYDDYTFIIDDMIETGFSLGFQIIIKYPTRKLVEALISAEFAYKIDNQITYSEMPFLTDTIAIDTALSKSFSEVDMDKEAKSYTISSLYDLELCAVITLTPQPEKVYNGQKLDDQTIGDYCCLSIALDEDKEQYDCINKRRKNKHIKKCDYFKHVDDVLTKYEERQQR